ncbi:hypothetical protein THRCLA_02432, partial [Thraustotheca clavata]
MKKCFKRDFNELILSLSEKSSQDAQLNSIMVANRVFKYVECVIAERGKKARNLIVNLCSTILTQCRDEQLGQKTILRKQTSRQPRRLLLLLNWLFEQDQESVLESFEQLQHLEDKKVLLRLYIILRDFTLMLLRSDVTLIDSTRWKSLLNSAVLHSSKYSIAKDDCFLPTKLSIAAADSALLVAHSVVLTEALDVSNQATICQLLRVIVSWYSTKHHRLLWLNGITHLLSYEKSPASIFAIQYHSSALLLQSSYIPNISHYDRAVDHLKKCNSIENIPSRLRNIALVLGRLKSIPPTISTLTISLATINDTTGLTKILLWQIVHYILQQSDDSWPQLWSILDAFVSQSIAPASTNICPELIRTILEFNYPLEKVYILSLDDVSKPEPEIMTTLKIFNVVLEHCQSTTLWLEKLSRSVLQLFFHHPSKGVRNQCLPLLPLLDQRIIFNTCGYHLQQNQSYLALMTISFVINKPTTTTIYSLLLDLIKNLGHLRLESTSVLSPKDINPIATTAPSTTISTQQKALLDLFPLWLRQQSSINEITDNAIRAFFADMHDSWSLHALRHVCDVFQSAFPQVLSAMLSNILENTSHIECAEDGPQFITVLRPYLGLRMSSMQWWVTCKDSLKDQLLNHFIDVLCNVCDIKKFDKVSSTLQRVVVDLIAKFPPDQATNSFLSIMARYLNELGVKEVSVVSGRIATDKAICIANYGLGYVLAMHFTSLGTWATSIISIFLSIISVPPSGLPSPTLHDNMQRGASEALLNLFQQALTSVHKQEPWIDFFLDVVVAGQWYRQAYVLSTKSYQKEHTITSTLQQQIYTIVLRGIQKIVDPSCAALPYLLNSLCYAFLQDKLDMTPLSQSLDIIALLHHAKVFTKPTDSCKLIEGMISALARDDCSPEVAKEILQILLLFLTDSIVRQTTLNKLLLDKLLRQLTLFESKPNDEELKTLASNVAIYITSTVFDALSFWECCIQQYSKTIPEFAMNAATEVLKNYNLFEFLTQYQCGLPKELVDDVKIAKTIKFTLWRTRTSWCQAAYLNTVPSRFKNTPYVQRFKSSNRLPNHALFLSQRYQEHTLPFHLSILENNIYHVKLWITYQPQWLTPAPLKLAAICGHLDIVMMLMTASKDVWTFAAMDLAAMNGYLDIVKYLHNFENGPACTTLAMDRAATCGHLEIVQFLNEYRTEGCSFNAISGAITNGYVNNIGSSWANCRAMDIASSFGDLNTIQLLHRTHIKCCTHNAMNIAAALGRLDIIKWLYLHRTEGCTSDAITLAVENGHLDIVKWLYETFGLKCRKTDFITAESSGCNEMIMYLSSIAMNESEEDFFLQITTSNPMEIAITSGNLEEMKYLSKYLRKQCSVDELMNAVKRNRIDILKYAVENNCIEGFIDYEKLSFEAAACNNIEILAFCLAHVKSSMTEKSRQLMMYKAVIFGSLPVFIIFIPSVILKKTF